MNSNSPLVSIISPAYNHEKYLADCFNSVIAQTYTNWEMIIVDDGSTDQTLSIAHGFASTDDRIRVFTQKNIGIFRLAETYNFAVSQSRGDYIAILEGDDWWFENKLELQMEGFLRNENLVLSWGQAYASTIDLKSNTDLYPLPRERSEYFFNTAEHPMISILLFRNIIPALTVLIRKSSLLKIGGFIQKYDLPLVDIPTLQELSLLGEFDFIKSPLGKWRTYSNQITKTYTAEIYTGFYSLAKDILMNHPEMCERFDFTQKKIDDYFYNLLVVSYSRSGRYKLIRRDYKGARKNYYHSLFRYGFRKPSWKLRSLIGLLFSFLHFNVEGLAGFLGKTRYN
jgi:glycosyltransferase involved in cell wall biosynthesis